MLQYERQKSILDYLEQNRSSNVRELSKVVFASEASVRRDLEVLEHKGLIKRVYGGVLLSKYQNSVTPAHIRDRSNSQKKELIAKRAAQLVFDGATLMFDSSSTARRICKYITHLTDVKIITNDLRVCNELKNSSIPVYCTGGAFYKERDCFLGPYAEQFLRGVSADMLFFSCRGISEDGIISDVSEEEISLRRVMLSRAERQVFLCDSSKLGVNCAFSLCTKDDVTDIICDKTLPWEE